MIFFENQRRARRQTTRLVNLMILSLLALTVLTSLPFVFHGFENYLSGTGSLLDALMAIASGTLVPAVYALPDLSVMFSAA
ncbi:MULTISPECIES: hypothetical protein [unclassified Pseudomonas]|uniref:hypothetical protein n=1 Tax=unclassified Pseudomonas TaxID=196821 RepID=UPI0030DC611D